MKIKTVICEGGVKRMAIDRMEDDRLRKEHPLPQKSQSSKKTYFLELFYDGVSYYAAVKSTSFKQASQLAIRRMITFLRRNYPRYDVSDVNAETVQVANLPYDEFKSSKAGQVTL